MLVIGLYVVIQRIEGNVLVPRILGRSLNLHPLVVFVGIVVGGSLAGILGMLLAAPVLATLRVVGHYISCRLYDRDPFAGLEEMAAGPPQPGVLSEQAWRPGAGCRNRIEHRKTEQSEESSSCKPTSLSWALARPGRWRRSA